MEKDEAVLRLQKLKKSGTNLHDVAKQFNLTVEKNGKQNKGWAGHAVERYLGLQINSARSPNLGSWELKVVPLKQIKNERLGFKETMAITMIDPPHILRSNFRQSHLFTKLQRFILVMRSVGDDFRDPTFVESIHANIIEESDMFEQVKADYDLVRATLKNKGFSALTGHMGVFIQPRTKGAGRGAPKTRAFYARPSFLKMLTDKDGYNYYYKSRKRR